MVSALDDALGELLKALHSSRAIENTILVFTTDNGGAAGGVDLSEGSNWPLRGSKATLWEGGVRGVSFVWSPLIRKPRVAHQLMHVSDWLPTLYSAAGGLVSDLGDIDGLDMWDSLLKDDASPRLEVLHNIDPIWNMSALRYGAFKYVQGSFDRGLFDSWFEPAELWQTSDWASSARNNPVDESGFFSTKCDASKIILALGRSLPERPQGELQVSCGRTNGTACKPLLEPCLFRIDSDPCERDNIAKKYPDIMQLMKERIQVHAKTMVPPINKPPMRRADPRHFNYTWAPYDK